LKTLHALVCSVLLVWMAANRKYSVVCTIGNSTEATACF
jgi:hypothetical protein